MKRPPHKGMSKRRFLKVGLGGLGGVCIFGFGGCDRERPAPESTREAADPAATADDSLAESYPAEWFRELEDNVLKCELCPKECRLQAGERGPCRVRKNVSGKGRTLAYANPALVQEDAIERKPFFHVLPGNRALSVSTAGCNLACHFCEVWDMALVKPEAIHSYEMPPEQVVEKAMAGNLPAVSYAFGEPVVFYEYMNAIAERAKEKGLFNLLHTAAYISPEPLRQIRPLFDAVNVDLKSFNPQFYRDIVEGELEPVLDSLKLLAQNDIHLEITNIQIPTLNDNPEEIREMCKWLANELGVGTPLHFARFYPLHRLADLPQTPVSTLEKARDIAFEEGLEFVYISRVTGHEGENTFCPGCGEKIIVRTGFIVDDLRITNGKCEFCGRNIPGRWEQA